MLLTERDEPSATQSKTERENTDPILDNPSTDTDDPRRAKLRRDSEEPKVTLSNTDNDEPKRIKLRTANDEPTQTQSSTERLAPNRPIPKRDSALPILAKDRKDNEEPR
jgi:hypothetical protein